MTFYKYKEKAMNSVVLIGHLAGDPELVYTKNTQTAVCRFTLAVDRPRKNGEDQGADFIRIVVWGKSGEACNKYLFKGKQAAVKGRIETGSYKNDKGETVYTTEVVADMYNGVEFLGGNSGSQGGGNSGDRSRKGFERGPQPRQENENDYGYDDLPDSFAGEDDEPF